MRNFSFSPFKKRDPGIFGSKCVAKSEVSYQFSPLLLLRFFLPLLVDVGLELGQGDGADVGVLGVEQLHQVIDVGGRQPQRLDLGQLGVAGNVGYAISEGREGVVDRLGAPALLLIASGVGRQLAADPRRPLVDRVRRPEPRAPSVVSQGAGDPEPDEARRRGGSLGRPERRTGRAPGRRVDPRGRGAPLEPVLGVRRLTVMAE